MPKLPIRNGKQMVVLLKRLGFAVDHVSGSHYVMIDRESSRRVVVPYHTKELPKGTLMSIIKAAGLSKSDL